MSRIALPLALLALAPAVAAPPGPAGARPPAIDFTTDGAHRFRLPPAAGPAEEDADGPVVFEIDYRSGGRRDSSLTASAGGAPWEIRRSRLSAETISAGFAWRAIVLPRNVFIDIGPGFGVCRLEARTDVAGDGADGPYRAVVLNHGGWKLHAEAGATVTWKLTRRFTMRLDSGYGYSRDAVAGDALAAGGLHHTRLAASLHIGL